MLLNHFTLAEVHLPVNTKITQDMPRNTLRKKKYELKLMSERFDVRDF